MATYTQIQAQIQKLQKEAEAVRKRERAETIINIKKAIQAFGLTAEDLGLRSSGKSRRAGKKAGAKPPSGKGRLDRRSIVAPKYRDAATGETWTGRGKQPKWLAAALKSGKKLDHFKL